MAARYKIGDKVAIFGKQIVNGKRRAFVRDIGIVKEIRGGGHFADYTQRRTYIIQLPNKVRMCFASELRLVKRGK